MLRRIPLLVGALSRSAGGAAWAGTKSHSVDVTLSTPTVVSGQRIPAGDHRLFLVRRHVPGDVSIEQGAEVVAKVDAKIEQRTASAADEELISRTMKDGTRALEEVRLPNQKAALVFPVS